jgi:hypothetical protein
VPAKKSTIYEDAAQGEPRGKVRLSIKAKLLVKLNNLNEIDRRYLNYLIHFFEDHANAAERAALIEQLPPVGSPAEIKRFLRIPQNGSVFASLLSR